MVMKREEPVETEQSGVGGDGGAGLGLSVPSPLVSLDRDLRARIPDVDTEEFCKEHGLGDDIRELLAENEYDGTDTLFVEKESNLKKLGFKIGHIAELRWALKKLLLKKFPGRALRNSREEYRPYLYGGHGGAGGYGGRKGGAGGTGNALEVVERDVFRFSGIGGGIGGDGGPSDGMEGIDGEAIAALVRTQMTAAFGNIGGDGGPGGGMDGRDGEAIAALVQTQMTAAFGNGPNTTLRGGRGGRGGVGGRAGGVGGLGGGPQMAMEDVAIFKEISGGQGGIGGASKIQGGRGGNGEAPKFASLLFYIDDETRRGVPNTQLNSENFSFNQALRERLQTHGFRTVGGLFEAYEVDLESVGFKPGQVGKLKAALEKVAAQVQATH